MTDILCRWLNQDVKLDTAITNESFEDDFSNGYMIGEILYKHGLQNDFPSFSKGKTSEAKLNNFMRLEPSFRLLDVPFNSNMAHDIMIAKKGATTKLMYQLFIALNRKKQSHLTGQTLEGMRPAAKVKLERIQTDFFTQRLKQQTPRQVDLTFNDLIEKFRDQRRKRDDKISKQEQFEEDKIMQERRQACKQSLEKYHQVREKQTEMYSRLKPIEVAKHTEVSHSIKNSKEKEVIKKRKIALETKNEIDMFEATHNLPTETISSITVTTSHDVLTTSKTMKLSDNDYMLEIKNRVQEDITARRDRGMRRRKLLIDQMTLLQKKENQQREGILADRLMKQCLQEKRITTQLMQIRKEKDNIRNNRVLRHKQFEEERMRLFQQALDDEAAAAAREREEQKVFFQIQKEKRKKLLQEKAKQHYKKHYNMCEEIVSQVIDLSLKLTEYRELTQRLIPPKLMRDWKLLFIKGIPLYEDTLMKSTSDISSLQLSSDNDGNDILDNEDLREYLQVMNEWSGLELDTLPGSPNPILTYIVYRLIDIVNPPKPLPNPPPFPKFLLKGAFLGLPYTGKTSILKQLNEELGIVILCPRVLIQKALDVYHSEITPSDELDNEEMEENRVLVEVVNESGETIQPNEGDGEDERQKQKPILSELAKLGEDVFNAVSNGESVDNGTIVDILIYEIKNLDDGSSWILDNFPTTLEQALLLASGLTGQGAAVLREQSETAMKRGQQFLLISEREVEEEEILKLNAACGLDLVVHFNVSNDTVLKRSTQHYKQLSDPPDVQQYLLSHDTHWSDIQKWYQQFRTLAVVDANQELVELYNEVQRIINEKLNKMKQVETMIKHGLTVNQIDGGILSSRSFVKLTPEIPSSETKLTDETKFVRKRRPSSAGSSHLPVVGLSVQHTCTSGQTKRISRGSLKSAESELFELMDPSVQPGTSGWIYYDNNINPQLVDSLAKRWPAAENIYSVTFKGVFRHLREERDAVCHYVYHRRKEFEKYLKRPDNKQEFVSHWQHSYNQISHHLHREDVMKAELHHRVDDLCDKLWDICDHRKSETEKERSNIINDQWLQDRMGLLCNHYISLMNAELTKFQDVVLLLKDYYISMQDTPIPSLPETGDRLPLIQLTKAPKHCKSPSATSSQQSVKTGGDGEDKDESEETVTKVKQRVPLIPHVPPSVPDVSDEKGKRKSTIEVSHPPREDMTGLDLDSQLIIHGYNIAIAGIFNLMNNEIGLLEAASAEANKPPTPVTISEPKEEKSTGKGGKKGGKSPGGKKGKATPKGGKGAKGQVETEPPDTPAKAPPISPQERAKRQRMEHMRREHTFALRHEEGIVKSRLLLIKTKGLECVNKLKDHVTIMYQEMEQWIGDYYQLEIESVNQLSIVLRCAVEGENKIPYELILPGVNFKIQQSVLTYPPSPPKSAPPPHEPVHHIQFTSLQLLGLYHHLSLVAPNKHIMTISFINFIHTLSCKSFGESLFPSSWSGINTDKISTICQLLYGRNVDLVDWTRFILCLAQPFPLPTSLDLLNTLKVYKTIDSKYITREVYMSQSIWLDEKEDIERGQKIKQVFYEIFKDKSNDQLDYLEMLFSLCASPDSNSGLLNAFTVAMETHITSMEEECEVTIQALYQVLTHGSHNEVIFNELVKLYTDIGGDQVTSLPLRTICQYKQLVDMLDRCNYYHLPDVRVLFDSPVPHVTPNMDATT